MGFDKDLRLLLKTVKKVSKQPFAEIKKSPHKPDRTISDEPLGQSETPSSSD
jgi:hypothetical protein